MSRIKRLRRICFMPKFNAFGPLGSNQDNGIISLSIDEIELIRLIDLEGNDQEQAALVMDVSRGTIQRMYHDARMKISKMLICGKTLNVVQNPVRLCDRLGTTNLPCGSIQKSCCHRLQENIEKK